MIAATADLPPDYSLSDLQNLSPNSGYYSSEVSYTDIRAQAIQEAALTLGTQAGLNYESAQIDDILNLNSTTLDRIFDFNQVMYHDNVLPPVLNTASNLVNVNATGTVIRVAGVTYTILSPARFVTAPPTWRDYIWMSYPSPELPDKTLLPQNSTEQAVWTQNVTQGWQEGINQAVSIFTINLNRLVQDFNGMVLYKELLLQNMVSPYAVDRTEQGITGNGKHMVVDDQIIQLTTQPQLLPNSPNLWQALPVSVTESQANTPATRAEKSAIPSGKNNSNNDETILMNALEKAVETHANSTTPSAQ